MPTREKYVPKHRDVVDRSALRAGVRNTVLASGVAAAATGISVSTGVLNADGALSDVAAASDLDRPQPAGKVTVDDLLKRERAVSRSAGDRRTTVDRQKVSALADTSGTRPHQGRADQRRRPQGPGPGADARVRPELLGVRLPGQHLEPGERLERPRGQPVVLGLRHPAGAARLEDVLCRPRLGQQRRRPRSAGASATSGTATARPAAPGASSPATAGTERTAQPTAFRTSFSTFLASASVRSVSAYAVGHMVPSSSCAGSLNPSVA